MFETLPKFSPDPILALIDSYAADQRKTKVDFGVGVYKTNDGLTPVMDCVKQAEASLVREQTSKAYLGSGGNAEFTKLAKQLILGKELYNKVGDNVIGFQAVGGTGALRLAGDLVANSKPSNAIWLGMPTWPNHLSIFQKAGLELKQYSYCDPMAQQINFEELLSSAAATSPGDAFLIHACCHNPSGLDLNAEQLDILLSQLHANGAVPIVDCAYAGFARGFEDDLAAVRKVISRFDEAIVAFSFSKNFSLYRERIGILLVKCSDSTILNNVRLALANIARTSYSMPPDHGASIVANVLGNPDLFKLWNTELEQIRQSIIRKRSRLADYKTNHNALRGLTKQTGMFSLLPISKELVPILRQEYGIYMTSDARINILGVSDEMETYFVSSLGRALERN